MYLEQYHVFYHNPESQPPSGSCSIERSLKPAVFRSVFHFITSLVITLTQ